MSAPAFDTFVASRGPALWRTAWLLAGPGADDLLDRALARVWLAWSALQRDAVSPEGAARRELVLAQWSTSRGRRRRPDTAAEAAMALPDTSTPDVLGAAGAGQMDQRRRAVLAVLDTLDPPHRAALVLHASGEVADWEAADALDVGLDQLLALTAAAAAAAAAAASVRAQRDAAELLAGLDQLVPAPTPDPYRAERVRGLGAALRRRRSIGYVAVCAAVVGIVVVPVMTGDPAPSTDDPDPATLSVAERLVDPLPIPDTCARVPDTPEPPGYDYEAAGADAVWLRLCPAPDVDGSLEALDVAPDETVVDREVDALLDRWSTPAGIASTCPDSGASADLIRAQVGTRDGSLHVVDMRVGCASSVTLDGRHGDVDSRAAFTETVGLLGTELLAGVDETAVGRAEAVFCPSSAAGVLDFERTTVANYPRVRGLALPLPAVSALVCRYPLSTEPAGGSGPQGTVLDAAAAETLRAAYLAGSAEPPARDCSREDRPRAGVRYGVVVSDATGSQRTFVAEPGGGCGTITGFSGTAGAVGAWLAEVLANPLA